MMFRHNRSTLTSDFDADYKNLIYSGLLGKSDSQNERNMIHTGSNDVKPNSNTILKGRYITLQPIDINQDVEELYHASHDGENGKIWKYMFSGPFESIDDFSQFMQKQSIANLTYTVIDNQSGKKIGSCAYLNVVPEMRRLEIGCIWYTPSFHRTYANTETCYLLIQHAFEDLKYRRVEWKCDNNNEPSKRAAERLGFKYEGIFRQHMIIKGLNRDSAYYSIIDSEWNDVKQNLEQRLAQ
jgi:RimJ/RimL family protein N-acetyltransferase